MFVTSTAEVLFPGFLDFGVTLMNDPLGLGNRGGPKPPIHRKADRRHNPEFCLSTRALDMNMRSFFFARKEKESEFTGPEHRGAHPRMLPWRERYRSRTISCHELEIASRSSTPVCYHRIRYRSGVSQRLQASESEPSKNHSLRLASRTFASFCTSRYPPFSRRSIPGRG